MITLGGHLPAFAWGQPGATELRYADGELFWWTRTASMWMLWAQRTGDLAPGEPAEPKRVVEVPRQVDGCQVDAVGLVVRGADLYFLYDCDLVAVPRAGGRPRVVAPAAGYALAGPQGLGDALMLVRWDSSTDRTTIGQYLLSTGEVLVVTEHAGDPEAPSSVSVPEVGPPGACWLAHDDVWAWDGNAVRVVPIRGSVSAVWPTSIGLLAVVDGVLCWVDEATGEVTRPLAGIDGDDAWQIGRPVVIGDWIAWPEGGRIRAVHRDGGAARVVVETNGSRLVLATDGQRLYWADVRHACLCAVAVDPATGPSVVAPTEMSPARRSARPIGPQRHDLGAAAEVREAVIRGLGWEPIDPTARPMKLVPWIGWLIVAALRYRGRIDELISRHGRRHRAGARGAPYPNQMLDHLTLDAYVVCRAVPVPGTDEVDADASSFLPRLLAVAIADARHRSFAEERLWRWAPSVDFLERFAVHALTRLGASFTGGWLRLPPDLDGLAGRTLTCDLDCAEVREVATTWFGDAEVWREPDALAASAIQKQHRDWIGDCLAFGDASVAWLLAAFESDAGLAERCDELLDLVVVPAELAMVVAALDTRMSAPPVPILLHMLDLIAPGMGNSAYHLAIVGGYVSRRGIAIDRLVAKLRAVASVEYLSPAGEAAHVGDDLLHLALVHAPAAAQRLMRRGLRSDNDWVVRSIAGAAVACGAPWAVQALQDALAADAPRADLLAMALTRTGRLSLAPLAAGMPIDSDVEFWRCRLAQLARQIAVEREAN